ncbi:merozoite surface protein 37/41 [Babesia divergens]|uniref:Merozoite surface protein 37/41 n=1 Tax=Babesia divergens TaxID=32595 RepID=A0AAD9G7X5_BABDI|nr:merozoite surface protein 37/41 [Babesia divergens]
MKVLGFLRASALCLLVSAFCSQHVSCGLFKSKKKPNEPATVEVSEVSENPENPENPEESTVKSEVSENPENPGESTVKSEAAESSENPGESGVRSSGGVNTSENSGPSAYERELDELLRMMAERRKEAVERLIESDAPFSLQDMEHFYGVLEYNDDVDPETVKKVGEKIHAYLKSIGIHGGDVKSALETLVIKIHKSLMDLVYGPLDIDIFNPAESTIKPQDPTESTIKPQDPTESTIKPQDPTESTVKPQDPTESSGDSEVEAEKKAEKQ